MSGKYNRPLTPKEKRKRFGERGTYKCKRDVFIFAAIRDAPRCWYCGVSVNERTATIDHIIPRAINAIEHFENYALCCRPCNVVKANKTLESLGWKLLEKPTLNYWTELQAMRNELTPTGVAR